MLEEEGVHGNIDLRLNADFDDMQTQLEPMRVAGRVKPEMSSDIAYLLTYIPLPRPANVWHQAKAPTLLWRMHHLPQTPLEM